MYHDYQDRQSRWHENYCTHMMIPMLPMGKAVSWILLRFDMRFIFRAWKDLEATADSFRSD